MFYKLQSYFLADKRRDYDTYGKEGMKANGLYQ